VRTKVLEGLGPALRWMRDRHGRKQYQVAEAAGITKGMLSAYETGRQRPSLDTLEKILDTLRCNLLDLHNALQIVNGRPATGGGAGGGWSGGGGGLEGLDIYRVLSLPSTLPPEEERALQQLLGGFHRLIRHLVLSVQRPPQEPSEPSPEEKE
jgi:transcriptional regulator with XRE-family HTH domain